MNNNYYKDYCDKSNNQSKIIPSQNESAMKISKPQKSNSKSSAKVMKPTILDMLSEFCHSQILNVDYLLGQSSQPFSAAAKKLKRKQHLKSSHTSNPVLPGSPTLSASDASPSTSMASSEESKVWLKLKSGKMTSLKDLLFADKLNTNAIQLQLTALSQQTNSKVNVNSCDQEYSRPKRSRRE